MKNVTLSNFNVKLASSKPDAGYSYEGPVEHLPRNISPASIIGLPEDRIQGIILKNIDQLHVEVGKGNILHKRSSSGIPAVSYS